MDEPALRPMPPPDVAMPAEADAVPPYAWLVLAMLMLANLLSFMDRYLMNVVGQPVKEELHLADWQLGMLNGTAFALSSTIVGLPVARLAARINRASLIAACMVVWSGMTMLCGLAGSLAQMLLFRTGVGVGEAGSTPVSHALIADYFPTARRGTALAVYTIGMPFGALTGSVLGGIMIDRWGWRSAFLLLGGPGILVAVLLRLVVHEVPRGRYDPVPQTDAGSSILATARLLLANRIARHIILGQTSAIMVAVAASTFYGPFLVRKFAISYTQMGVLLSASYLAGGTVGNLLGGIVADVAGRRDRRWYPWIAALGIALGCPLYLACYLQPTLAGTGVLMFAASVPALTYTAPTFAVLHALVSARTRATMVALIGIVASLIGGGLGPLLGGLSIDLFAARHLPGFAAACPGGTAAPHAAAAQFALCRATLLAGTQSALIAWTPLFLWPAFHFWWASRQMGRPGSTD